ncbi:SH3 domain-containing protein [Paracoccus beibuensis]|uniref:SH3 domain-containing protein n=1 Tax=Paracoccus beibuensis TaxID=547602 RepID=UPI002AD23513|nr:SH3 domain-containing protein [Paracoccus beibuensis]
MWRWIVKLTVFVAALAVSSGAAVAQQLDVDFQITEDTQIAGCSGASVVGLDPNGDGFLAVRSGPGANYRKIDELHNGDEVRTCEPRGEWWGIYYDEPRRKGWVHENWLGNWAG